MIVQFIDGVSFPMKEAHDFSFLSRYGAVFCVFSQNDSGNISFGAGNGNDRYFIKIAGAHTANSCTNPEESIQVLKSAMQIYEDLSHPNLIKLVHHYEKDDLFVAVFQWSEGDCLFDYWNFEKYSQSSILSPGDRFKQLSSQKKLRAFHTIFDFLVFTESKGYVAVDFYDGSILYDFLRDAVTICDIDFFRISPSINEMGEDFWGTKRLKSPEEYRLGAKIDSVTNVFTMGALLFHFFGTFTEEEIERMYRENKVFPCRKETWELRGALYDKAVKAISPNPSDRYGSMGEFFEEWKR